MPVLRWTHDHHRDVRALEAAARAAARVNDEPGDHSMTRHGMVEPTAAGARPPASDPRASIFKIAADSVTTSLVRDRLDCAEAQRSRHFASILTLPSGGGAIADIGRRAKSP